jgi:hypothetical protein
MWSLDGNPDIIMLGAWPTLKLRPALVRAFEDTVRKIGAKNVLMFRPMSDLETMESPSANTDLRWAEEFVVSVAAPPRDGLPLAPTVDMVFPDNFLLTNDKSETTFRGSSVSTALAVALASLIIFCIRTESERNRRFRERLESDPHQIDGMRMKRIFKKVGVTGLFNAPDDNIVGYISATCMNIAFENARI